jgi:hypothetical protein
MEEFPKYFFRPLFTIIFRPEMLKFHLYSILTGETMVGFVIYCVLKIHIINGQSTDPLLRSSKFCHISVNKKGFLKIINL